MISDPKCPDLCVEALSIAEKSKDARLQGIVLLQEDGIWLKLQAARRGGDLERPEAEAAT
jgi:hypothetical protein